MGNFSPLPLVRVSLGVSGRVVGSQTADMVQRPMAMSTKRESMSPDHLVLRSTDQSWIQMLREFNKIYLLTWLMLENREFRLPQIWRNTIPHSAAFQRERSVMIKQYGEYITYELINPRGWFLKKAIIMRVLQLDHCDRLSKPLLCLCPCRKWFEENGTLVLPLTYLRYMAKDFTKAVSADSESIGGSE